MPRPNEAAGCKGPINCVCHPREVQQKVIADPRIVQQRDRLGIIKALGEFGELDLKLDEAYKNELPLVFEDGRQKDGVRTRSWECFRS